MFTPEPRPALSQDHGLHVPEGSGCVACLLLPHLQASGIKLTLTVSHCFECLDAAFRGQGALPGSLGSTQMCPTAHSPSLPCHLLLSKATGSLHQSGLTSSPTPGTTARGPFLSHFLILFINVNFPLVWCENILVIYGDISAVGLPLLLLSLVLPRAVSLLLHLLALGSPRFPQDQAESWLVRPQREL